MHLRKMASEEGRQEAIEERGVRMPSTARGTRMALRPWERRNLATCEGSHARARSVCGIVFAEWGWDGRREGSLVTHVVYALLVGASREARLALEAAPRGALDRHRVVRPPLAVVPRVRPDLAAAHPVVGAT